jgi:trafficking protein particle complex subunit 8
LLNATDFWAGLADSNDLRQYLFDTDFVALRTFVREMVTQSIIPFMESRVTGWNDQVASRRRGISGRFMSLSKRWTGFGSSRGSKSSNSSQGNPGSNYNTSTASYDPDSPEASMHRLADYAFMLRDWRLSSSIYDILRVDFGDDKAWSHHASANEMMALSLLLSSSTANSRLKIETIPGAGTLMELFAACSSPWNYTGVAEAPPLAKHRNGLIDYFSLPF